MSSSSIRTTRRGVADHARNTVLPVGGFLLLALIVLCATLVPILRRVTAAVEERNRRLIQQAATLEQSLATAQEARTEAEAARRAMVEQNKRLRELDRLKDEFLSLVSHELRTPLTSIRGYLDLVLDEEAGELNPEQRRFLQAVERNSGRLLRLVGDLLFVAQADAGRLSLEQGKVDLVALAAECVEGAVPAAAEKSIDLVLAATPVPAFVGDRGRLAQVLDNLVSNALKFTPEGGSVEVSTKLNGDHVSIEVSDTGIGIPVADQPRLFERFFRSSVANDRAIPGTGLGLAIVKAIVEAHKGRDQDRQQGGSRDDVPDRPAVDGRDRERRGSGVIEPRPDPRLLVLVADDDEDILQLLSFRLERAGYEIVLARSGDEALRLALDLLPAVAVLDVMMPGLDGFEVTRELRRNAATSTTPVILLTARAQASDIARGMAAGADDYVKKPFDARDLVDRVDRLLRPRLIST